MAFWLQSKEPGTRIITAPRFLAVVLMGAFFITPCWCGPIKKDDSPNTPWWCQPCRDVHKTRHPRNTHDRDVLETAYRIVLLDYDNYVSHYMKDIDSKLKNITKKQLKRNSWLPRKKFFNKLTSDYVKYLPEIYRQTQVYAVVIDKLSKMEFRGVDGHFDTIHRQQIFSGIKNKINMLLCELQQKIAEHRLKMPDNVPAKFADEKKIPSVAVNLLDIVLKDYSILAEYHNFLQKCMKKMFGKNKRENKKKDKKAKSKNKKRISKGKRNKKVNES